MSCVWRRESHFTLSGSRLDGWDGQLKTEALHILPWPIRLQETLENLWMQLSPAWQEALGGLHVYLVQQSSLGSFYRHPNLIVLDDSQLDRFVAQVPLDRRARAVVDDHARRYGRDQESDSELLYYSIAGRVLAHELGHALRSRGVVAPYADEEANADYLAGALDAARGKSRLLGEEFFFSIGCNRAGCDHPPSAVRKAAYSRGYDEQLQVTAGRLWRAEQIRRRQQQEAWALALLLAARL